MQVKTSEQQINYDRLGFEYKVAGGNGRFATQSPATVGPQVLLYVPTGALDAALMSYARNISSILHGSLTQIPQMAVSWPKLIEAANRADLMMVHEELSPWQKWLGTSYGQKLAQKMHSSLLVIRAPRWPIRRILFVSRAEANDKEVIPWLMPLAQATQAEVSILAVLPAIPAMYRRLEPYAIDTAVILNPSTVSGHRLRELLQELKEAGIPAKLRLRDGEPDCQIRQETAERDCDLIMIAAEPQGRLVRCLWGELVGPLFTWLDRPLLVARSRASAGTHR